MGDMIEHFPIGNNSMAANMNVFWSAPLSFVAIVVAEVVFRIIGAIL